MSKKPYDLKPIYSAYTTTNESGDAGACIACTFNKSTAHSLAKDQGWYGGNGVVKESKALIIGDEVFILANATPIKVHEVKEIERKHKEEVINKAMEKLSPEERDALGLGG